MRRALKPLAPLAFAAFVGLGVGVADTAAAQDDMFGSSTSVTVSTTEKGPDVVAAIMLSQTFPGAGEWYNSGFSGGFPFVECLLGNLCCFIRMASIFDAAAGRTDDAVRINFWASPND